MLRYEPLTARTRSCPIETLMCEAKPIGEISALQGAGHDVFRQLKFFPRTAILFVIFQPIDFFDTMICYLTDAFQKLPLQNRFTAKMVFGREPNERASGVEVHRNLTV